MSKINEREPGEVILHEQGNTPTRIKYEDGKLLMRRFDGVINDWGSYVEWNETDIRKFIKLVDGQYQFERRRQYDMRRSRAEIELAEKKKEITRLRRDLNRLEREYARELAHRQELQAKLKGK